MGTTTMKGDKKRR